MYQFCTAGAGPERTKLELATLEHDAASNDPEKSLESGTYWAQLFQLEQTYSRQRRDCLFRLSVLAFLTFFVLFVATCYYDAPTMQMTTNHDYYKDKNKVMSSHQCEANHRALLEGDHLIQEIESLPKTHDTTTHCRQGAPVCDWQNPTLPDVRQPSDDDENVEQWTIVHESNVQKIQDNLEAKEEIDVVLMGDTMVEHMEGKEMGVSMEDLKYNKKAFDILFHKNHGGRVSGMTLGITGDRCSNLLYRIENGEIPEAFKPKVFWLVIGTRDWELGLDADAIVAGILKIAKTIHLVHKEAYIVINSILPRGQKAISPDNTIYASISEINDRLSCYVQASRHYPTRISFFNATDIFIKEEDGKQDGKSYINPVLMPDFVNPGLHGEVKWGHHVIERVLELTSS